MSTVFLYQSLIAFMALLVTDVCWAVYVRKVGDKAPLQASLWAVFLFLSGAVAVISYTTNPWLLIPAGAGAFIGTYLAVWLGNRKPLPVLAGLGVDGGPPSYEPTLQPRTNRRTNGKTA